MGNSRWCGSYVACDGLNHDHVVLAEQGESEYQPSVCGGRKKAE